MSRLKNLYQRTYSPFQPTGTLEERAKQLIEDQMHGLCFSPYMEGQEPGMELSDAQISERLAIIKPYCKWIRTFSCTEGNEKIPGLAKEQGFKTLVGIWLDGDFEHNEEEIEAGIALAKAGNVDMLAVGNEVMLREEMSEQQLIDYINRVKEACPGIPVGYVDAYYLFEMHRGVSAACDVLFANCYPYWEGYHIDHALIQMKEMYFRAKAVAGNKPVVISETGWPTQGTPERDSVPSFDNALNYFVTSTEWCQQMNIDLFYFSSYDEAWKVSDEGDVGAFWGILDKDGKFKYG